MTRAMSGVYGDFQCDYIQSPPTPPLEPEPSSPSVLETGLHVIATEARALQHLDNFYRTSAAAQDAFTRSVRMLASTVRNGGKLVICGMGKSGKIGQKLVASMNSFSIPTVFLHPSEALHGDLGIVREHDLILLITFSGKTPELLHLLPHLPQSPKIILTSLTDPSSCELLAHTPGFLLPAPLLESEKESFGLSAPTTSITVTLAVAHALAISAAKDIHECIGGETAGVFAKNHPGGALGASFKNS